MSWSEMKTFMYGVVVEVIYLLTRPFMAVLHNQSRRRH